MNVKRFLIFGTALAASLALAACGGGASGGSDTVAVRSIDGVGNVLVDSSGQALYASDVEADGKVKCIDACESFWKPLTVDSATPTAASSDVGKLAVIKRPDGSRQPAGHGRRQAALHVHRGQRRRGQRQRLRGRFRRHALHLERGP
jgi:predicted lipoprotein with Yx(FWY)xxD motif